MGQALQEGRLDVALAPVAAHFLNPELAVVPVAGIVSKGPVQSVRLLHHRPLGRVLRLWADSNSQTSVLLTRLVLKRWHGLKSIEVKVADMREFKATQIGPWDACLQIGDAALNEAPYGMTVTDLGGEWARRVGKPFVYAVWTARNVPIAREVHTLLLNAKNEGVKHFDEMVKDYKGFWVFEQPKLKAYLEKNVSFDLGPAEMQGLLEFKKLLTEEGLL
jgi:predicted solute-binding protein